MSEPIKATTDQQKLLSAYNTGTRNYVILRLLLDLGLKPHELCRYTLYQLEERAKRYDYFIPRYDRKGMSESYPYIISNAPAKKTTLYELDVRSLNRIVKQAASITGLSAKYQITSESLRKTHFYNLFVNGISLNEISSLLKHPSLNRTIDYLSLNDKDYAKHYLHLIGKNEREMQND